MMEDTMISMCVELGMFGIYDKYARMFVCSKDVLLTLTDNLLILEKLSVVMVVLTQSN